MVGNIFFNFRHRWGTIEKKENYHRPLVKLHFYENSDFYIVWNYSITWKKKLNNFISVWINFTLKTELTSILMKVIVILVIRMQINKFMLLSTVSRQFDALWIVFYKVNRVYWNRITYSLICNLIWCYRYVSPES